MMRCYWPILLVLGQAIVNTATTAGAVTGVALPVYEGLKAQGANIP